MAPIRVIRTMTASVLVMPLALAVAVFLAVPWGDYPPPFLPLILGAVAVGGVLVAETAGYAAPSLPPGTDRRSAADRALAAYRGRWLVRAMSTELVVLVGLLLAFMLGSRWPYVVALVLGLPIMAIELWPSRRVVDRIAARLELAGTPSFLDDALHGRLPA